MSGYAHRSTLPQSRIRSTAPSEREPGRVRTIHRAARKPQHCGRFSSPLRKLGRAYYLPFIGRHSLREGAGKGCTIHPTARKPQDFGRFSSPLRDSECFTFFVQAVLCHYNSADSRGRNLRDKCFYDLFNLHRRLRSLSMLSAFWASWRIAMLSPSTMADCRLSTAADKSKSISASASLLTGSL